MAQIKKNLIHELEFLQQSLELRGQMNNAELVRQVILYLKPADRSNINGIISILTDREYEIGMDIRDEITDLLERLAGNIEDLEKQNYSLEQRAEECDCAVMYLNDKKAPRSGPDGELSLVGRIIAFQKPDA